MRSPCRGKSSRHHGLILFLSQATELQKESGSTFLLRPLSRFQSPLAESSFSFKKMNAHRLYPSFLKSGIIVYSLTTPSFSSLLIILLTVGWETPMALASSLSLLLEFLTSSETSAVSVSFNALSLPRSRELFPACDAHAAFLHNLRLSLELLLLNYRYVSKYNP